MKIDVAMRALIPTRLIAEAAEEASRRELGRIRPQLTDIRVTVTDRRLKPGVVCCQVEVDIADGTAVMARSVNGNPVEVVSEAFDRAAQIIFRRLREEWARGRTAQYWQSYAMRSHAA